MNKGVDVTVRSLYSPLTKTIGHAPAARTATLVDASSTQTLEPISTVRSAYIWDA
jgi:hypothetical protein